MGQAKLRGTFEERKAAAKPKRKPTGRMEIFENPTTIGNGSGITTRYVEPDLLTPLSGLTMLLARWRELSRHRDDLQKNLDNLESNDATT